MKKIFKHPVLVASLALLLIVILCALLAPLMAPYGFQEQMMDARLVPPSAGHWMGTDALGRDLYSRLLYGARVSMAVGIVTALASLFLGTFVGSLAGYFGGWVDSILMRIVDIVSTLPSLLVAILVMVVMGQGLMGILVALAITGWVNQARLVRGQVLQVREQLHVESARASGAGNTRILFHHVLPLIVGPMIVALTFQIPANIMAESFLSFMGIGIQPPQASWGTLAADGFRGMRSHPHLILIPGTVIFATMLAFQFLGDGLRDILDPHEQTRIE